MRSLARDLGDRLGCGGYLAALRRTEAAGLHADDAVTPERLEALAGEGRLADAILPVGDAAADAARLARRRKRRGPSRTGPHRSSAANAGADGRRAVFAGDELLGIGSVRAGVLQPEKVLPREADR